jgi:hypothetical protein
MTPESVHTATSVGETELNYKASDQLKVINIIMMNVLHLISQTRAQHWLHERELLQRAIIVRDENINRLQSIVEQVTLLLHIHLCIYTTDKQGTSSSSSTDVGEDSTIGE